MSSQPPECGINCVMENPTLLGVDSEAVPIESSEQLAEPENPSTAMEDYYALIRELLVTTLVLIGIIFPAVWFRYDVNVALNYLLGACTGMLYLRLL